MADFDGVVGIAGLETHNGEGRADSGGAGTPTLGEAWRPEKLHIRLGVGILLDYKLLSEFPPATLPQPTMTSKKLCPHCQKVIPWKDRLKSK